MSLPRRLFDQRNRSAGDGSSIFSQGRATMSTYYTALTSLPFTRRKEGNLDDDPLDLTRAIEPRDLKRIRKIGGGGFADVYFLHHNYYGDMALKRVREAGEENTLTEERRRARREAQIWQGLHHPNVLNFMGVYEDEIHFFLVSSHAPNGTIVSYTKNNPAADPIELLKEAGRGLAYLHQKEIIHGDVKGSNVLISGDVHALICDFGLTRTFESIVSTHMATAGSFRWMSPEVLVGGQRTPASDVWAFGMMTAEVLSGGMPFSHITHEPLVVRAIIEDKERPPPFPLRSQVGQPYGGAWKYAASCWQDSPDARPTMDEVDDGFRVCWELEGHTLPVFSVSFSPNCKTLASGSSDKTIRLWDVAQAIPLGVPLEGHAHDVKSVPFSPDGTTLVSGSDDRTLRLWDVTTGQTVGEPLTGHAYRVRCAAFSPDGRTIASGSGDRTIRIWDSVSRRCIAVLRGHTESVWSVAFSPDGKTLVSGSWDRTVRRWDVTTNALIGEPMEGHADYVRSVAISSDGSTIASGSDDKTICLWDARSGGLKGSPLEGHTDYVYSVAFHPNCRLLASGSWDNTVRIWDLTTTPPTTKLELKDHTESVYAVALSPDGKWLASGSWDRTVRLWDLKVLLGTI